jgi:hypothetical protein
MLRKISIQYWAAGRPKRLAVLQGAIFGIIMGVFYAVQRDSTVALLEGVPAGVLFGVLMYFLVGRRNQSHEGLDVDQYRAIDTAVRTGGRVSDPALAQAVVTRANEVTRHQPLEKQGWMVFSAFAIGSVIGAVLGIDHSNTGGAAWWSLSAAFWLVMGIWTPSRRRRQIDRAVHARDRARSSDTDAGDAC